MSACVTATATHTHAYRRWRRTRVGRRSQSPAPQGGETAKSRNIEALDFSKLFTSFFFSFFFIFVFSPSEILLAASFAPFMTRRRGGSVSLCDFRPSECTVRYSFLVFGRISFQEKGERVRFEKELLVRGNVKSSSLKYDTAASLFAFDFTSAPR